MFRFTEEQSKTVLFSVLSLLGIVLIISLVSFVFQKGQGDSYENQITVRGTAEVFAVPDIAGISFTVRSEAESVSEAEDSMSEKMNAILNSVEELGIEDKDIKTTSFQSYPRYEWKREGQYSSGTRVLAGYEVSQTVQVKVRDIDQVGKVLEVISEGEAENISGPNFTVDDKDAYEEQARELAIKDAKEKADSIAKELGVRLKKIISFSENNNDYPRPYLMEESFDMAVSAKASVSEVNIPTGENKITHSVTITYKIR